MQCCAPAVLPSPLPVSTPGCRRRAAAHALYVRVPVRTAIARAAMRKTGVTPERIETYQRKMASAMEVASSHADEVEIVDVTFDDAPLPGTMHGTEAGSITAVAY